MFFNFYSIHTNPIHVRSMRAINIYIYAIGIVTEKNDFIGFIK